MTFGEFVREKRLHAELSLREFCRQAELDPSNWSKVERNLLPALGTRESLENIARLLNLKNNSSDWAAFFDLASLSQQRIPDDVYTNKEVVEALPVFFRTVRGEKPSEEELDKLIALIKKR
jgi:transcriptional regulator with XRE-family HTH domain